MEDGRKEKDTPEIRDISHTARIHASMILADVFYRYAAVRPALLPNGKRGNPGLRPAQANGQQSKDCMPSVSLRSTLFASMAVCNSHSKRFVLFPTTGNEYQEAF